MTYIQVKPKDGLLVLQPDNFYKPMPAEGALVPNNAHYQVLLREGSIALVPDEPPAPAPTPAPPAPPSSSTKGQ